MNKWTIGGVPEHFNLPWEDLIAAQQAAKPGALPPTLPALSWQHYPAGTGAMIAALDSGELDIAILLTEGAAAARARGADWRVLSSYVLSPLIWGVHVAPARDIGALSAVATRRFAISRFGSGSHLMAHALARREGWILDERQFVVVNSLDGAVSAFAEDRADVFLWERFMSQPLVDQGIFARLDDFVAPWSAFVTCVSAELAAAGSSRLEQLITAVAGQAMRFAEDPATPQRLNDTFGIAIDDARRWLAATRWATGVSSPDADLRAAEEVLIEAGIVDRKD